MRCNADAIASLEPDRPGTDAAIAQLDCQAPIAMR